MRAKLRQASGPNYGQVVAVVLGITGDISVLDGDDRFDPDLLRGAIDADAVRREGPAG